MGSWQVFLVLVVKVAFAGSRLYLQKNIYEEYLKELKTRAEAITIGDPMSNSTQLGPLATLNQLQNIEDKIKQTLEQGGKIITGGIE